MLLMVLSSYPTCPVLHGYCISTEIDWIQSSQYFALLMHMKTEELEEPSIPVMVKHTPNGFTSTTATIFYYICIIIK